MALQVGAGLFAQIEVLVLLGFIALTIVALLPTMFTHWIVPLNVVVADVDVLDDAAAFLECRGAGMVPAGVTSDVPVAHVDIYPTFLSVAGAKPRATEAVTEKTPEAKPAQPDLPF